MFIREIVNEQDIDFYNRKGTGQPDYMYKGNPGVGSMSDDEIDALYGPFMNKYGKSLEDPKSNFWIDNAEVWDDLNTYQQGQSKGDKYWRRHIPDRQYDLKYNVDDPREPRLINPKAGDPVMKYPNRKWRDI
jgi:hypothetical protein